MLLISSLVMLAPPAAAASDNGGGGYVSITFDDGFHNVYDYAFPTMIAAGVPGTFFVNPGITDQRVSFAEMREMEAAGWEIGSHTMIGQQMTTVPLETAVQDMIDSKAALVDEGIDCVSFAYPNGLYNQELLDAGAAIYERQRGTNYGPKIPNMFLKDYPDIIQIVGAYSPSTLESLTHILDVAVRTDSAVVFYFHNIGADGTIDGTDFTVQQMCDIINQRKDAYGTQAIRFRDLPQAEVSTYVWDGEGMDNLASNAENWRTVAPDGTITNDMPPATGSRYIWNETSPKDCTWDLPSSITAHSFITASGYTGRVTVDDVDLSIGPGGMVVNGGTVACKSTRDVYIEGAWLQQDGSVLSDRVNLVLLEPTVVRADSFLRFRSITAQADIIMLNGFEFSNLTVGKDATVTLNGNNQWTWQAYDTASVFANHGSIIGTGEVDAKLHIRMYLQDVGASLGHIGIPLNITLHSSSTTDPTLTLTAPGTLSSSISMASNSVGHILTLDAAGHSISAAGVMVGTRAAAGNGTVHTSAWDSTAGGLLANTNVVLADGGSAKLAPGQSLNLAVASDDGRTASWTMTATGAQAPIVTGLKSGSYLWYLDGVEQGEIEAGKDGTIALSYESTGLHELSVKPTSMTLAMDGLAAAVGIVAVLAVLGGLFTMLGRLKF